MRAFAALVAAFCMIGFAPPAQAIGMQFCDDIKDDHARMACLQEHISHLEQTIVVLAGRLAAVENALQKTIAADASYKLKSVAKGDCLGLGGEKNDQLALVSCDNPNSWTALSGAPIKKPTKTLPPRTPGLLPARSALRRRKPPREISPRQARRRQILARDSSRPRAPREPIPAPGRPTRTNA